MVDSKLNILSHKDKLFFFKNKISKQKILTLSSEREYRKIFFSELIRLHLCLVEPLALFSPSLHDTNMV